MSQNGDRGKPIAETSLPLPKQATGFSTRAVHGGAPRDEAVWGTGSAGEHPHVPPLFLTSNFEYADSQAADQAARGQAFIYARHGNPTVQSFEQAVAELEDAGGSEQVEAVAFGSGTAALFGAILGTGKGSALIVSDGLYGGSTEMVRDQLPAMGLQSVFVPAWQTEAVVAALRPDTRAIVIETITNPLLRVSDVVALAALAQKHGIALIVDSTFATPCLLQPLALGATAVVHSVSKYLAGHSDLVGGIVVANSETAARVRNHRTVLGAIMDPFCAWLSLRGLRTLPLRIERQVRSAQRLAEYLEQHPRIRVVHYPGLASHPDHARAAALLRGPGAIVSFDAGSLTAARSFYDRIHVMRRASSLGGVSSLVTHPASFSHRALSPETREAQGITDGLLRISVGIEDVDDLLADTDQALA
ncbi:MAG: PLP-dependent aspartate aminotransferase family protein [Deltaproteobacteria bacterium]|nr:PLP-dependent aspartate aminotransferase family protein [Deltaproteobacteria bacterium]